MLAASAVLVAAGLFGLGIAPNIAAYLAAWIVIGAGMRPDDRHAFLVLGIKGFS